MAQSFRKTVLTTAAIVGFASMSPAVEPPLKSPVEIVKVSAGNEESRKDAKTYAAIACLIMLGGLGAYAFARERSMSGDKSDDDCWK